MDQLPEDVLLEVTRLLTVVDALQFRLTCKTIRHKTSNMEPIRQEIGLHPLPLDLVSMLRARPWMQKCFALNFKLEQWSASVKELLDLLPLHRLHAVVWTPDVEPYLGPVKTLSLESVQVSPDMVVKMKHISKTTFYHCVLGDLSGWSMHSLHLILCSVEHFVSPKQVEKVLCIDQDCCPVFPCAASVHLMRMTMQGLQSLCSVTTKITLDICRVFRCADDAPLQCLEADLRSVTILLPPLSVLRRHLFFLQVLCHAASSVYTADLLAITRLHDRRRMGRNPHAARTHYSGTRRLV